MQNAGKCGRATLKSGKQLLKPGSCFLRFLGKQKEVFFYLRFNFQVMEPSVLFSLNFLVLWIHGNRSHPFGLYCNISLDSTMPTKYHIRQMELLRVWGVSFGAWIQNLLGMYSTTWATPLALFLSFFFFSFFDFFFFQTGSHKLFAQAGFKNCNPPDLCLLSS
jgi:hypothetical protein